MVLAFGFLLAVCCWGYQASIWLNTGNWAPMPFLPMVDQWLPAPFFVWLSQPETLPELSHYTSWALHRNAGLVVFVFCWLLQLVAKPRG